MSAIPLSVIVLTHNEEVNLPDCLESVQGLECEIFVVDSGSTDRTIEIAKAHGAQVAYHPFEHYSAQRNWAQLELPITTDWVLHLDADERLTPELVQEINLTLQQPPIGVDGFVLRKRTIFMGRWMRHGGHYPSYHTRLFRRQRGECEDRLYDQHFVVTGPLRTLQHDYIDVLTSDLTAWTTRHMRWAELEALDIRRTVATGARVIPRLSGNPVQRRRWLRVGLYFRAPIFMRAFLYWFYRYVIRLGYLDGTEGLIFHFLQGCWYRFMVDVRLYEAERRAVD